jgi:tetratricopeptide (TPR) repeat protein
MKSSFRAIVLFLFLSACFLPISVMAQGQVPMGTTLNNNPYDTIEGVWVVAGRVVTVQGDPVRSAVVTVTPTSTAGFRNVLTDAQGDFSTEYHLVTGVVGRDFIVVLSVKKKGFQTTHAYVKYGNSSKTWRVPLTLRASEEDADLLSPTDLISGVAPKLKQLGPADGLAAKSEKDYTRGAAAFLDQHNPERAVPLLSKVVGSNPTCIGCRTMLGLADLGWCAWDDAELAIAESVKATLADRKMGRPESLVAYGTWLSWQHEAERAEAFFLEALKFTPQDALTLQELGRSLLALQKYEAANNVLKRALAAGAGPEARFLYAASWLGAGRSSEAAAEMNRYLDGRDVKNMPQRVRQAWVSIQNRQKVEAAFVKTKPRQGREIVDFLQHPPSSLTEGLEPAEDQSQLSSILDAVGAKILEMTKSFPNTSSLEEIHQEKLGHKGAVTNAQNQKFRYLCMVPSESWGPGFMEYRADPAGNMASPIGLTEGFMLTKGFASAAFIFHPTYRSESTFRYLGRQTLSGRVTFVLAFAQIPGKAHFSGKFRQEHTTITTLSQGAAWIDTTTHQVIRLHTDLLTPLPELRLEGEATNIDFKEVHFKSLAGALWLPEEVTVTLDWNGKVLRNTHHYSDFRIFNVDASDKVGTPKVSAKSSEEAPALTITPALNITR